MNTLIRYLNYVRLAGFPLGYGLTGALVGGAINRVMIADMGLSATLVGFLFAVPLLISPIRVWLGYRSDGYPILGRRREPYIVLGALIAGIGIVLAVLLAVDAVGASVWLVIGLIIAFAVHGFGRNLSHNTFQALLADKFEGDQRPRAITLYEVATLLGLVMGAGALGKALESYDPGRLVAVTIGAMIVVFVLSLLAAIGQEPRTALAREATEKARELSFTTALREVATSDPQVRLFFALVVLTFIGTLAQDVLLEPYGALVLGMDVGDTTRLTAFWGVGVLISMLISGTILVKFLGYKTVLRLGLIASIFVFAGIIAAGATGNASLFKNLVFVMGLGTGLAGAGMLAGIITFTTLIRAGLLMGIWGFANLVGRAIGSIMGGMVVDLGMSITDGNALVAYSAVFALEIIMLIIALALSTKLHVRESHAQSEEQLELLAELETEL